MTQAPDGGLLLAGSIPQPMQRTDQLSGAPIVEHGQWLFAMRTAGIPEPVAPMFTTPVRQPQVAAGPSATALALDAPRATLYSLDTAGAYLPDGPFRPGDVSAAARDGWQPRAIASGDHGAIYVINAAPAVHAVQLLRRDGTLRAVATLPTAFVRGGTLALTRGRNGILYSANGTDLLTIDRAGRIVAGGAGWRVSLAVGVGASIYFARASMRGLYVTNDGFRTVQRVGRLLRLRCTYTPPS
jgi:hypothetical protein